MTSVLKQIFGNQDLNLAQQLYARLHIYATLSTMNADLSTCQGRVVYCVATDQVYVGKGGAWVAVVGPTALLPSPVAYAATITLDLSVSDNFTLLMTGNAVLEVPANLQPGQRFLLEPMQDATGNRLLTYASIFKFPGGSPLPLSTLPNAIDLLTCYYDGTRILASLLNGYA